MTSSNLEFNNSSRPVLLSAIITLFPVSCSSSAKIIVNASSRIDRLLVNSLSEIIKAHQDLEARKILGPAVIIPN